MKVPYTWLQEFVPDLPSPGQLGEIFDGLGLPMEAMHEYPGAASGSVVVLVEEVESVAGSDHLKLALVYDGRSRSRVVTGAPNVRAGLKTAFAGPGASLPAIGITVEIREMAGQRSEGLLLSPKEMGVYDYAGGLIELGSDVEPGTELAGAWPSDQVFELEITPNRADAFSILGVARDLAAKLDKSCRNPTMELDRSDPEVDDGLTIEVSDTRACPGLTLRRIDGLTVAASPVWLQRRLASVGLRPRNNVVDVTNFVTFELGQPSHAYNADVLSEGVVQVRRAQESERLTALGGEELELTGEDLVIATPSPHGSRAIGLAGVIGGLEDSVDARTSSVALEVAHFDPVRVRRTAKRHGLSTDAHYRFERGVDPNLPPKASARAARLIAELGGGSLHPGVSLSGISRPGEDLVRSAVRYRPARVTYLMDFEVEADTQRAYLEALGCGVESLEADKSDSGETWLVTPPSWRFDIAIEEDLVEEIGRLHGYEHIGETVPVMHFVPQPSDATHRYLREQIAGLGFQEAIGYVFTSDGELERSEAPASRVRLSDPQGVERSVLRTAIYPGLLAAASLNRGRTSLALFEVGRVFLEEEIERVALLATGPWVEPTWHDGLELDFFLFKGLLERLAERRNARLELRAASVAHLHPGVCAHVFWNGRPLGSAGRLHPQVAARFDLADTYVAELDLPLEANPVRYREPLRQPHAERDIAVIAPEGVGYGLLDKLVRDSAGELLESLEPFDIYSGEQVPQGMRSVAMRLRFRHAERALRDQEVDGHMENVIGALRQAGYDIRDR